MAYVYQGYGSLVHPFPYHDLRDSAPPPYSSEFESLGDAEYAEDHQSAHDTPSQIASGTASATTGSPHIPIELWRSIFECVRSYSQHLAAQMPLLCKALRAEAEAALYHQPHLTTLHAALAFTKTVSATPRLARAVRTISFAAWPDDKAPPPANRSDEDTDGLFCRVEGLDGRLDVKKCRMVGAGLEKLRRLTSIVVLDRTAMRTIAAVFNQTRIRLLHISGEHLVLDQPTVAFLKTQHRLEELRLYHRDAEDFENLGLRRIRVMSCPYRLLSGLGDGRLRRLTHLNVTSVMSEDDIAGIIDLVGPQLISLRLEQNVWKQQGRLYPTNGHAWNRCPRLKFLHVRHCQPHANAMCYLGDADDAVDASNLPPALETLVWSPAWTRARTHHLYPEKQKRAEIRRFAEAVLRASAALRSVIYEWSGDSYYKSYILASGEWRELPTTAAEADDEGWRYVR